MLLESRVFVFARGCCVPLALRVSVRIFLFSELPGSLRVLTSTLYVIRHPHPEHTDTQKQPT